MAALDEPSSARDAQTHDATQATAQRFYVVDFFRGLASVVMLVWHYNGFYWLTPSAYGNPALLPLHDVLGVLYAHGNDAVLFFWMLSGFVFACTYAGKRVSAWTFAVSRFARLYPLHFVTLLVAAFVSFAAVAVAGKPTSTANDWFHFLLNVLFVSGWRPLPFSFNAPIWSVSVEIVIYAAFWCALPILFRWGGAVLLTFVAVSGAWFFLVSANVFLSVHYFTMCAFLFFSGALVFYIHSAARRAPIARVVCGVGLMGAGAWLLANAELRLWGLTALFAGALTLIAAAEDTIVRRWARPLRWFGDATYSMYLWHHPLILLTAVIFFGLGLNVEVFASPVVFMSYIAVIIAIGRVSYLLIELPAKRAIRRAAGVKRDG